MLYYFLKQNKNVQEEKKNFCPIINYSTRRHTEHTRLHRTCTKQILKNTECYELSRPTIDIQRHAILASFHNNKTLRVLF